MINTFYLVHIVVGLWLALVNVTNILTGTTLAWNNFILGLAVVAYNVYHLYTRKNVDIKS